MLIKADLVMSVGGLARIDYRGRIEAPAWCLLPGTRVYLRNSGAIVRVTKNEGGVIEGVKESDGHPCMLSHHGPNYEVVTEVTDE